MTNFSWRFQRSGGNSPKKGKEAADAAWRGKEAAVGERAGPAVKAIHGVDGDSISHQAASIDGDGDDDGETRELS